MYTRERVPQWLRRFGWIIALLFAIIALLFWWLASQPAKETFTSDDAHLQLRYDSRLRNAPLSEQDKRDKVVLRLVEPAGEPELLATLRYEEGLKPLTAATKQDLRDTLVASIAKTYPQRFPSYKQLSTRGFEISSRKAQEITFQYKNPSGDWVRQRFILIIVSDDKAVYLSLQAKEADFDRSDSRYFESIVRSLHAN